MQSLGLLILRATVGGLLIGHGGQKLFGWQGGEGLKRTGNWLESMGLRPGLPWAGLASASEFGGGLLTLLGFLNPIGPLLAMGSMLMATLKVHSGKPIWVTQGGAELPVTNLAILGAISIMGPGAISADRLLGVRIPRWIAVPGLAVIAATVMASAGTAGRARPAKDAAPQERAPAPARTRSEAGSKRPATRSRASQRNGDDAIRVEPESVVAGAR